MSLFRPNLLGSLQIKGFQGKELFCWKALLIRERGFAPNTQNTVVLPFLLQVVLCSQLCIPMKQSLELILNTSDEKGSSYFLQFIPVSSFSNILFLTRLKRNALSLTQPEHRNTPKCPVSSLKGSITKVPQPETSRTAGHTAELLWKLTFLWDLSGVQI